MEKQSSTDRDELVRRAGVARSMGDIRQAIDLLTKANRERPEGAIERSLLELRSRVPSSPSSLGKSWPPEFVDAFRGVSGLPEVEVDQLDVHALGSGIRHHGALLVRRFASQSAAVAIRDAIDAALAAQADGRTGSSAYDPFTAGENAEELAVGRAMTERLGGGLLAVDSPHAFFLLMEVLGRAGFVELVTDYLGERPVLSADKTTFRRLREAPNPAWHQDGSFMGDARAVNVWISLSHCGGDTDTRGLDVVPSRIEELLPTGTHGAEADIVAIGGDLVHERSETGVLTPLFRPGDALLFDERFVHRTSARGGSGVRHAVEAWFFSPSRFPEQYGAVAV